MHLGTWATAEGSVGAAVKAEVAWIFAHSLQTVCSAASLRMYAAPQARLRACGTRCGAARNVFRKVQPHVPRPSDKLPASAGCPVHGAQPGLPRCTDILCWHRFFPLLSPTCHAALPQGHMSGGTASVPGVAGEGGCGAILNSSLLALRHRVSTTLCIYPNQH